MPSVVHAGLSAGRLALIVASRFVLNAMFRVAYVLIPFVAARYAVDEQQAAWIVTMQVLAGLGSPLGGWLGERQGYRRVMLAGLGLALSGALLASAAPRFWVLVLAFAIFGLGMTLFQPSMQAYVSVLTPYQQRGRAIGMVELSWALAGIVAVPALAWLVERQQGMGGMFGLIALCLALVAGLMGACLPAEPATARMHGTATAPLQAIWTPSVRGMLAFAALTIASTELVYVAQPSWATRQFNASLTDLGTAALVYGLGELLGSLASILFTDRLGKRMAAMLGFGLAAAAFVALALVGRTWPAYLAAYLVLAVCAEFAIVAMLTLASTVSVVGRAAVMALIIAVMQVSRAVASRLGLPLLEQGSLLSNALVAAALALVGVAIAWRYVREGERQSTATTAMPQA